MACNVRKKPRSSINVLARRGSRRTMHSWCACAEAKERILQGTGRAQLQDCLKKGGRPEGEWENARRPSPAGTTALLQIVRGVNDLAVFSWITPRCQRAYE